MVPQARKEKHQLKLKILNSTKMETGLLKLPKPDFPSFINHIAMISMNLFSVPRLDILQISNTRYGLNITQRHILIAVQRIVPITSFTLVSIQT